MQHASLRRFCVCYFFLSSFFYGPFVNDNLLYFFVNSNNITHRKAIHSGKDGDYLDEGRDCLIVLRLAEHKKAKLKTCNHDSNMLSPSCIYLLSHTHIRT